MSKELQVGAEVVGGERDEVDDCVVLLVCERSPGLFGVASVRPQDAGSGRGWSQVARRPPDHEMDVVTPLQSQWRARAADDAGTADEQELHDSSVEVDSVAMEFRPVAGTGESTGESSRHDSPLASGGFVEGVRGETERSALSEVGGTH